MARDGVVAGFYLVSNCGLPLFLAVWVLVFRLLPWVFERDVQQVDGLIDWYVPLYSVSNPTRRTMAPTTHLSARKANTAESIPPEKRTATIASLWCLLDKFKR